MRLAEISDSDLAAGVVEQEAAGAVRVFGLTLLQTRLAHQSSLLVTQNLPQGRS